MKKIIELFTVVLMFFGTGCDIIREENRLIPLSFENTHEKKVLLIEFTDQNCKNCLNATAEINKLIERFSDTIVVVSIHANPLPFPLKTSEGNEYEQYFQAEDHPAGIIDGGVSGKYMSHDPQGWGGFVFERLKTEPVVNIDMAVTFNETTNEATINAQVKGNKTLQDITLQLWIIEKNIIQWQLMLDGTRNDEYIHNHVFRSSINGTWGETFSIGIDEKKDFLYTFAINSIWKTEDISIVGFVYNKDIDETFNTQEISLISK